MNEGFSYLKELGGQFIHSMITVVLKRWRSESTRNNDLFIGAASTKGG